MQFVVDTDIKGFFDEVKHTGEELILTEMDCHHKRLWSETKDDRYSNLILMTRDIHRLIHATNTETIQTYLEFLKLNKNKLGNSTN